MKYYLNPQSDLPEGFRFPKSYLDFLRQEALPDLDPWWFLCESQEDADDWLEIVKEQYPERKLVPFAKFGALDDIACFDGADTTGNPKVYYVHTFTSPGWEDRGWVDDFDAWLENAKRESAESKAERTAGRSKDEEQS
jgi:hypothetical protein